MNKKQILLTIITLLISTIMFANRVDAVVMWMQCTANSGDVMNHNDDLDKRTGLLGDWAHSDADSNYKKYNTFALINNISNESTRNVVYVGNNFFDVKGPTFIMDYSDNGDMSKQACWYNNEYSDDDGPMHECDRESDFIDVEALKNGTCPNAMYQTTGYNTSGGTKGDFVVMQGISSSYDVKILDKEKLVIYYYGNEEEKYVMIEAYDINGVYGLVYTSPDNLKDLLKNIGLISMDSDTDILSFYSDTLYYSDEEFVDETMFTQLVRLYKLNGDFFEITKKEEALLINTGKTSANNKYKELSDKKLYNDNNEEWESVKKWHEDNNNKYIEKIELMRKFEENSEYSKLIKTATDINNAVDKGRGYSFSTSYDSLKMIEDLKKAYTDLYTILEDNNYSFIFYDNDCNEGKTTDAAASFKSSFYCNTFGKNTLKEFSGKNVTMVEKVLDNTLLNQLNNISGDDVNLFTIKEKAQDNAKILAKAAIYLKNSNLVPSGEEEIVNNYIKLVESFGISLVRDCETLIGEDLKSEIKKYTNIIKIAVPIILIVFGIIDFTKAIFSGNEEDMKKSQKAFIKRLVVAILFFFTPVIVNVILSIANKVWPFISPNDCGLF